MESRLPNREAYFCLGITATGCDETNSLSTLTSSQRIDSIYLFIYFVKVISCLLYSSKNWPILLNLNLVCSFGS